MKLGFALLNLRIWVICIHFAHCTVVGRGDRAPTAEATGQSVDGRDREVAPTGIVEFTVQRVGARGFLSIKGTNSDCDSKSCPLFVRLISHKGGWVIF